ncbi:hypothetical protein [Micromonospora peucetia]|uniref:Uncharacterized protein n=1 Tax=Micromonospora peucetia TaxID=47871 RepID=A0A1C6V4A4_9ACTN|nr:hypothetical protein [Micromonospora peucetia]SCL61068.1 hypothetical protein GA0070608_2410 [Micromonospora peucetia]
MSRDNPTVTGRLNDPAYLSRRGKAGAQARHSVDTYVRALVKRAPQLTENHRAQLRALLASTDGGK